ncbi:hypothetical protein HRI_002055400 [Hibiscus trionum]|uniref:Endonuclease/exonuclease/phosphatase domain-containing protein n=1 Tax=Hibiscus trionum TaxID=183268 RepID=A0A9W7HVI6_HIBTR|nr:hypothetical protein HRI_002055400 [Hibiscus trionum]
MDFSIISWNVRGLGKVEKLGAVRRLIRNEKAKFILIQETKLEQFSPAILRSMGCYQGFNSIFAPAAGSAGGLLSAWRNDFFSVTNIVLDSRFIAIFGKAQGSDLNWGIVNVYGPTIEAEKHEFFRQLLNFIHSHKVAWIVGGDFNAYLCREEKIGMVCNYKTMDIFRNFVNEAQLVDLPMHGGSFTWSSNREIPTFVRLDRFFICEEILVVCHNLNQFLLPNSVSDHNAIALKCEGDGWGPKPFKLFNYMLEVEGFEDLISNSVVAAKRKNGRVGILNILRGAKSDIKAWSKEQKLANRDIISETEADISRLEVECQKSGDCADAWKSLNLLRQKLWELLRREERA